MIAVVKKIICYRSDKKNKKCIFQNFRMASSSSSVFIKEEVEDLLDIKQEDIEQYIKVEIKEEFVNENIEIDENEKEVNVNNLLQQDEFTENELNHIQWLNTKKQSLDSMKGKYNSQLQKYLRLAKLRNSVEDKNTQPTTQHSSSLLLPDRDEYPADYGNEKTIIPSRKRLLAKRAERAEAVDSSIGKRMRHLEQESYDLDDPDNPQDQKFHIEVTAPRKPIILQTVQQQKKKKRLKRKTELERERRAGLAQLFDELVYWVELDRKK